MSKTLPIVEPILQSSATQGFYYAMLMADYDNIGFLCNNYIPVMVKGVKEKYIDFTFDGIFDGNGNPLDKTIIIGEYHNIEALIISALKQDCYIVMSYKCETEADYGDIQKYKNYVLMYGIQGEEVLCLQYDLAHNIKKYKHTMNEIREMYLNQDNEWDYELFIFKRYNYCEKINITTIKQQILDYLNKKPSWNQKIYSFYENRQNFKEVNIGYEKYYGVGIYDYLTAAINGKGIKNTRSFEFLIDHKKIIYLIISAVVEHNPSNMVIFVGLKRLINNAEGIRTMANTYLLNKTIFNAFKLKKMIKGLKKEEIKLLRTTYDKI